MKVVITGGAGFIGSHIAESLSRKADVVVIDDLSSGRAENLEDIPVRLVRGSVCDRSLLQRECAGASCIIHQAAVVSVPWSISDPVTTHEVNTTGTLNVLLAARDLSVGKVIFASSAAVYGRSPQLPKQEDMLPEPSSPYAASKVSGEYYCRAFTEQYGLDTVCLRYFNVYGPRQDAGSSYAAVIPAFITRLMQGLPPVIYGSGEQTRDFINVRDVVRAVSYAMEKKVTGTFNIASGRRTSVLQLAAILEDVFRTGTIPVFEPGKAGDILQSHADITKAERVLGFSPCYSLDRGLSETVRWFQSKEQNS